MQLHRPRSFTYLIAAALAVFTLYALGSLTRNTDIKIVKLNPTSDPHHPAQQPAFGRDITELIEDANRKFDALLARQTRTMSEAAEAYRQRRGVHPPPGFNLWYDYAVQNGAVIVEDFWDQIYHDLDPFWGMEPKVIRAQARELGMSIVVKDGKIDSRPDWFWHKIWAEMIGEVADKLPDMVIPMNAMDESRVLVPWEQMNTYMAAARKNKKIAEATNVTQAVRGWQEGAEDGVDKPKDIDWNGFNVYRFVRNACPKDSPARQFAGVLSADRIYQEHKSSRPTFDVHKYYDGRFVVNYTEATDICSDASIGGLHGALIHPFTSSVTDRLIPLFGGSKFQANNEILFPAPMYWSGEERFGGNGHQDRTPWEEKQDIAMWRGTATGGRSKPYTWHLFHRHRFVAITNGTKYSLASEDADPIFNRYFRQTAIEALHEETQIHLGDWLNSTHDVAFTNLVCDEDEEDGACWYTNNDFKMAGGIEYSEHFHYKYLPDVDGNSFSGRYRGFLLSDSLPIKATIYREWHDSRLLAWKHFVPMNNQFTDYYKIMEHFLGSKAAGLPGHDNQAKKIANEGRIWADKVLRTVDMQIYVLRLLLEYSRITDDNRNTMGWVGDILATT